MRLFKRKPEPKIILVPVVAEQDLTPNEHSCIKHWDGGHWKGIGHFYITHYLNYKQYLIDNPQLKEND